MSPLRTVDHGFRAVIVAAAARACLFPAAIVEQMAASAVRRRDRKRLNQTRTRAPTKSATMKTCHPEGSA